MPPVMLRWYINIQGWDSLYIIIDSNPVPKLQKKSEYPAIINLNFLCRVAGEADTKLFEYLVVNLSEHYCGVCLTSV